MRIEKVNMVRYDDLVFKAICRKLSLGERIELDKLTEELAKRSKGDVEMSRQWEYCTQAVAQCRFCDYLYKEGIDGHKSEVKRHMEQRHPEIAVTYDNKRSNHSR